MDVREELAQLYRTYNPRRLKDIEEIAERFKGREHAMMTALREKYARHGVSTDSSFAGGSAVSWAEVLPRQTTSRTVEAAAAAPAAVDETDSSTPAPAPSPSRTADAPCAESASGDAAPAAAFRALITPSCSGSPATEHSTTATAVAAAAARHQRHREMVQLIDQLRSVDVGRLAERMAMLSAPAPSPASRTPRLPWRQSREASALEVDNDRNDGRYNNSINSRELAELLRHTAVFLNFFSQCASRFLLLAEEEEHLADAALTTSEGPLPSRAPPQSQERRAAVEVPQRPPHHGNHTTCGRKDNAEQMRRGAGGPPHGSGSHGHNRWCGGSSHGGNAERAARGIDISASSSKTHMEHPATIVPVPVHCAASSPTPSAAAAAPVHSRDVDHADATVSSHHRRSSCVRGIRQLPLFSTLPLRSSSASPPPRAAWRDGERVTGVGDRGGGSRSPTYRTTTVSPLTSPKGRRSGHSPHTPSQPRYSRGGAVPRASAAATTMRTPAGQRSSSSPLACSPAATPPRPPTSPPMHGGALVLRSPPSPLARRRVHTWTPSSQSNRYTAACAALRSGDCVVLQPGVYYEELVLEGCGHVELTSAYPGAAVVLRPSSDLAPALRIRGAYSRVELKGIVLVQGDWAEAEAAARVGAAASVAPRSSFSTAPPLPLLSVSDGAALQATACHFYGGAGGGVVIAGPHTHATLDLCLISLCGFAGIYVHHGASVEVRQSKVKKSEAGLRVLQSSFYVHESTLEENKTDGIVVYEGGVGILEGSSVMNNGGNGLFLEGGAGEEVRVIASTIELNALYGVHRFRGSTLHIRSSYIRDNGLLPISEDGG
ncbi:Right handed beta helix region family protein [Leishmania donovani]|nr:Right handed beta helix region family protein [Leishmania donovani]